MLIIIQQKNDLQWLIFYYFVQFMATLQLGYLLLIIRQTKRLKNNIKHSEFSFFPLQLLMNLKTTNKNEILDLLQNYGFFYLWYNFCQ